jgi:glutamate-ammonia-ligase adenylyltransferase
VRADPSLFRAICLLFDRSAIIHKLVCAHPEILDELLFARMLTLHKPGSLMRREIRALATESDEETARRLWLWVKAEQVRISIAMVLSGAEPPPVELALSRVASVAVDEMLQRVDPEGELAVVAMGKFGGREMSPGSDLDMMVICAGSATEAHTRRTPPGEILGHRGPIGSTFEVDMRLRPHGQDGPLVVSLPALRHYHQDHGGQLWERQALLRSRAISDRSPVRARRDELRAAFITLRDELLFGRPPQPDLWAQIRQMRQRIETEKAKGQPPHKFFKAGPGGILDIEFICQAFQLAHAGTDPKLRSPNTRESLRSLARAGLIPHDDAVTLLDNYNFLRKLEFKLRRQDNQPITVIEDDSDLHHSIATWMGFADQPAFWSSLEARMEQNRQLFIRLLQGG